MPHWPISYGKREIKLGLSRIRSLLEILDHPEKKIPPVVHIAGTNGKGSILAYLRSIFEKSTYLVHRYISPHIINFNERIMLAGHNINDEQLFYFAEKCRVITEQNPEIQYSFFEGITAIAFLAFSEIPANVVLLETGMGGRLDATNVIQKPAASIISTISLDHTEHLGETLVDIAKEKAGIIKQGCPCIISWQPVEAMEVLKNKCAELQAPIFACEEQWNIRNSHDGFYIELYEEKEDGPLMLGPYKQSLYGLHQIVNAATAVVTAFVLRNTLYPKLEKECISYGIANATWPARMEKITSGTLAKLLPNKWELWLDGAHNPGGAEMLAYTFNEMQKQSEKPLYMIHGRTEKHDIKAFLQYFMDMVKLICCMEVNSEPKAEKAEKLQETARDMGFKTKISDSVTDAVLKCTKDGQNNENGGRILICGSLYLASDVIRANSEE